MRCRAWVAAEEMPARTRAAAQLVLPQAVCEDVYQTSGYSASVANLSRVSLQSDNVFSDGVSLRLASVSGSVAEGYEATLRVAVAG